MKSMEILGACPECGQQLVREKRGGRGPGGDEYDWFCYNEECDYVTVNPHQGPPISSEANVARLVGQIDAARTDSDRKHAAQRINQERQRLRGAVVEAAKAWLTGPAPQIPSGYVLRSWPSSPSNAFTGSKINNTIFANEPKSP